MDVRANLALIPDPRINRCKEQQLADILLLCITAMVCGVEYIENIVFFGLARIAWLKQYLTIDAMGCRKQIASDIIEGKGVCLGAKGKPSCNTRRSCSLISPRIPSYIIFLIPIGHLTFFV